MKDWARKVAAAGAVTAALGGGSLAAASPAHAINRVPCTSFSYLWVQSNQTTCWANAGTATVNLFSVHGYSSGNNAGYLNGTRSGRINFARNTSRTIPLQTIYTVHIN